MSVLRSAVRRGLALFGLAPASTVAALSARAVLERESLEKARNDLRTWKARSEELGDKAREADELATRLAKVQRQAQRADTYLAELREARERVERAEKAIALSREHLMSTETKLDLVEAAIAVLDRRTRG